MEYRLRRHDGQYRWILANGVPRFAESGAFAGYIGTCVDISDQKEAETALSSANAQLLGQTQSATARLAAIVEGSEEAIIAIRQDGVITDWNRAATGLYGYSAEEVDWAESLNDRSPKPRRRIRGDSGHPFCWRTNPSV